ncbi:response regulator [Deinococcus sonorensis]|uniref:Response regulator n=2 Tax=Deinococcus sonorensis TaxID=309891 RepID=A0AAU7UES4_9DEIO
MLSAPDLLLVEDNNATGTLILSALSYVTPAPRCQIVPSGEAALSVLSAAEGPAQWPRLIVLDLILPGMSGFSLLRHLSDHPQLCRIPVVVLSVSHAEDDILASYKGYASSYLVKPHTFDDWVHMFQALLDFWLRTATLVPRRL